MGNNDPNKQSVSKNIHILVCNLDRVTIPDYAILRQFQERLEPLYTITNNKITF